MATRYYSNVAPPTSLTAGINSITTTITIDSAAGLPVFQPYTLALDPDTPTMELVQVDSAAGTTLTVQRAIDGTSASNHSAGAVVKHVSSARDFAESRAHEEGETGVHGVIGDVVGTTDVQTLSSKTLTSPTINSPNINDGTITNTAITTNDPVTTGNLQVNGTVDVTGNAELHGTLTVGEGPGFDGDTIINGNLIVQVGAEISTNSGVGTHLEVQKGLGTTGSLQEWTAVGGVGTLAIVTGDGYFDSQSRDVTGASLITAAAGWSLGGVNTGVVKNGVMTISGNITRTGANITTDAIGALSTGIITMGTLTVGNRPKASLGSIQSHCSNTLGTGSMRIGSPGAGVIELIRWQANSTISTGNTIGFLVTFPLS